MNKLMYINCPIRVTGENKDDKKIRTYVELKGTSTHGFSETDYENFKSQIIETCQLSGGRNLKLKPCSKEELETKEEDGFDQIGYVSIYVKIFSTKDGEEKIGYSKIEMDFGNFFSEEICEIFAEECKMVYKKNGYKNVSVDCCAKEEYDRNNSDDEDTMFEYSWDDENEEECWKIS